MCRFASTKGILLNDAAGHVESVSVIYRELFGTLAPSSPTLQPCTGHILSSGGHLYTTYMQPCFLP